MAVRDEQLIKASVETGLIEESAVAQLRLAARREQVPLLSKVLAHFRLPLSALHRALAEEHGLRFINMSEAQLDNSLTKKLPSSLINRKQMIQFKTCFSNLIHRIVINSGLSF